ncbi:MAG: efflux RND transporter periplasmic adaptor subunit [Oscillospiraceae bacterium]|jgi:HlyD family secretion protein|nr:efflux RND transporter periplasmic adaptor subunit [Oscillospiraceae bacterium]
MKKFLLVIILGAAAWYGWSKYSGNAEEIYVYKTQPVVTGDITASVSATGNVSAVETVEVGTQVSGTIKALYADYNSLVKKGQLIAQLDTDMLEAQVSSAKANVTVAKANVAKAKATLADAERIYNRNKELHGKNAMARTELDSSETQLQIAKAGLSGSEASVVQAEATLKIAETNFNYAQIYSPVDGVVINRQVDVGQTVAASLTAPTLFTIARDLTQMRVLTNVDEADIGKINEGQDVLFTVDAWPQTRFRGKVVQVRLAPQIVQNVVTYTVVLDVANPDIKLKPGMTANVSIVTDNKQNVIKIPTAAVRFSPPDFAKEKVQPAAAASPFMPAMRRPVSGQVQRTRQGPSSYVWTVKDGQLKERIEIRQGITESGFVEVTYASPDIKEGEEVAISWTKQAGK